MNKPSYIPEQNSEEYTNDLLEYNNDLLEQLLNTLKRNLK